MSTHLPQRKLRSRYIAAALAFAWLIMAGSAAEAASLSGPLPDVAVRSLATSGDVLLAGALAGRPAVILLTAASPPSSGEVELAAAGLQREYGPWFAWVAVLSGPFTAEGVTSLRDNSPLRLEHLFHDREGALRASLGIERLPALLLVDGDGAIRGSRTPADGAAGLAETARALQTMAAASRQRAAGMGDFRLPRVGGGDFVSFLDVAGREGTLVAFLQSRCLPCAQALEVLDFARDRRGGGVSFVAVFLDSAPDSRIRGFLAAAGATPDFVLRDPELLLAGSYGIDAAPALLVLDAGGGIVLSRSGYREADRDALYGSLMAAFDVAEATARGDSVVAEARRMNDEACAYLREGKAGYALLYQERIGEMLPGYPTVHLRIAEAALAAGDRELALRSLERYLAAASRTYGDAEVRETMAGLAAAGR